jgi:hypothetical protein
MNGYIYQEITTKQLAKGLQHDMGGSVPFSRRLASYIRAFFAGWWRVLCAEKNGEEATLICRK